LSKKNKEQEELDRLDVAEAERRLADPNDATIPYEQVRRELGLGPLPDWFQAIGDEGTGSPSDPDSQED
jgi:hypothetical protein